MQIVETENLLFKCFSIPESCITKDNGDVCVETRANADPTKTHFCAKGRKKAACLLHLANGYRYQVT
jgi:hypothetical protein